MALEVEQFQGLFGVLQQRERTLVLLDCGSGLRCGELIGLQWGDFDFACKQMSVTRSVVDMVSGKVKTEASQKTVPLDDFMIEEVLAWYRITPYQKPEDWVFASDSPRAGANRGKQPYWPMTIMRMFIKPLAKWLGIGNLRGNRGTDTSVWLRKEKLNQPGYGLARLLSPCASPRLHLCSLALFSLFATPEHLENEVNPGHT